MKLTRNGEKFFVECTVRTFGDDEIQAYNITNDDIQELMDNDYINYDEDTDQYYWLEEL